MTNRPDRSIARFLGFRKSFWIYNKCSKRARILITPTAIGRISQIGIDNVNASINWEGTSQVTDEVIAADRSRKFYAETSQVYLTIFIEFDSGWKQLRKNKLLHGWRHNYNISEIQLDECIDLPHNNQ